MNPIIQTLAEEAEFSYKDLHLQKDNFQRFAELLLFECIKLAVFRGDKETGKAIKDHFELE